MKIPLTHWLIYSIIEFHIFSDSFLVHTLLFSFYLWHWQHFVQILFLQTKKNLSWMMSAKIIINLHQKSVEWQKKKCSRKTLEFQDASSRHWSENTHWHSLTHTYIHSMKMDWIVMEERWNSEILMMIKMIK